MKTFILVLLIALVLPEEAYTQTPLSHTIPVRGSQSIEMHFDYPELIRVSTWDGPSIEITGTVSINGGENDDAFIVEHERVGDVVKVHSRVSNIKQLPHLTSLEHQYRQAGLLQPYGSSQTVGTGTHDDRIVISLAKS